MSISLTEFITRHRNHHSHASYLSFIKGAVGMIANPEGTENVFDVEDGLRPLKATENVLDFVHGQPAVAEMINSRYLQPVPDTQRLAELPEGTLGWAYAQHIESMGFDPDYYRKLDIRDDVDYILMRLRQTHDIWHVVTGFNTSRLGEICVKAVELAQTHRPMAAAICAGGMFRYLFHDPDEMGHYIAAVSEGYQLGLRAGPLLGMRWEEMWDRPVEELRAELGVQPVGPEPSEFGEFLRRHQLLNEADGRPPEPARRG